MTYKEVLEYAKVGLKVSQRDYPELTTRFKSQEVGIAALEDALRWHKSTEEIPTAEGQYLCCKIAHNGAPCFDVYGYVKDLSKIHYRWCGAGFYGCDIEGFFKETPDYWKEIGWVENEL